jgi:hypothetical protein
MFLKLSKVGCYKILFKHTEPSLTHSKDFIVEPGKPPKKTKKTKTKTKNIVYRKPYAHGAAPGHDSALQRDTLRHPLFRYIKSGRQGGY